MRNTGGIPKEFLRALSIFDQFYKDPFNHVFIPLKEDIWQISGNIAFYAGTLTASKIPSDSQWVWNQAKSRHKLTKPESKITIEILKLVSRKTRNSTLHKPPSMKLWQFNIFPTDNANPSVVLWCEKGMDQNPEFSNPPSAEIDEFAALCVSTSDLLGEMANAELIVL